MKMTSNDHCRSKIVFIGLDDPFYLPPIIPYIEKLHEKMVAENDGSRGALDFVLFPVTTPETVNQHVHELEELVKNYYRRGYRYIGLPSQSTLLRPFLLGTGGDLNNIPVDRRWPDVYFMIQDPIIAAADYPDNVYRFFDVNTLLDERLAQQTIDNFVNPPGRVYVIYEGAGDAYSTELANMMIASLLDMGMKTNAFVVGKRGSTINDNNYFDNETLDDAVDFIKETIPPPPARSVIIHIINPIFSEEYTQTGLAVGLFSDFNESAIHYSYAYGYWPEKTTIPVPLEFGKVPVIGIPSLEAASLGIPLKPSEYYSFPFLLTYLDAYLWAATCQKTDGINDKQLRFDETQTRISYYLANFQIPPNSIRIRMGPLYFNPRWFNPEAPVIPT
jgi:hypothetical protein